jgi:hypothetical protein
MIIIHLMKCMFFAKIYHKNKQLSLKIFRRQYNENKIFEKLFGIRYDTELKKFENKIIKNDN